MLTLSFGKKSIHGKTINDFNIFPMQNVYNGVQFGLGHGYKHQYTWQHPIMLLLPSTVQVGNFIYN
jgi:hypothetical protein